MYSIKRLWRMGIGCWISRVRSSLPFELIRSISAGIYSVPAIPSKCRWIVLPTSVVGSAGQATASDCLRSNSSISMARQRARLVSDLPAVVPHVAPEHGKRRGRQEMSSQRRTNGEPESQESPSRLGRDWSRQFRHAAGLGAAALQRGRSHEPVKTEPSDVVGNTSKQTIDCDLVWFRVAKP